MVNKALFYFFSSYSLITTTLYMRPLLKDTYILLDGFMYKTALYLTRGAHPGLPSHYTAL